MSDIVPDTILGTIEFYEQRLTDWATSAEQIGLTPQQANDLVGRVAAARNAYNAAQLIRQQSRNATATQTQAVGDLRSFGADLIATIRAFADLQADPTAVFQSAEINPPKPTNTPAPPPVPATDVSATLLTSGAIRLSWKGTTANGTFYDVYRRIGDSGQFTLIGSSATRGFDDNSLPAGTASAAYYCVSRRDQFASDPSTPALVRFGSQIQPGGETQLGLAA